MTKDEKIVLEIYQQMYEEASPKGDFKKMMELGETKREGFFNDYTLSIERQQEILNETMKKYKIPKWRRKAFNFEVLLGCSPSSKV